MPRSTGSVNGGGPGAGSSVANGGSRKGVEYSDATRMRAAAVLELKRRELATERHIWTPQPGPQQLALDSLADELFYGGAAGGGKTDLLIGASLTKHRKSIIFRREYPQLRDIVTRTHDILAEAGVSGPRYNETAHIWRDLPGNRTLEYGAVAREEHSQKYQGRPHDLKGFDELPQFSPSQYKFIIGWTRSTVPGQRTRVIGAGNPPTTPEGEWVIVHWRPWLDDQYGKRAKPGELRWFVSLDEGDEEVEGPEPVRYKTRMLKPRSRTFIPAHLTDNIYLAATDYDSVIDALPEPLRTQMRDGNFGVKPATDPWQAIPSEWVIAAMERSREQMGPQTRMSRVGVDPARGGRDRTVIATWYANWMDELIVRPGKDTPDGPDVAREVVSALGFNADNISIADPVNRLLFALPINIDILGPGSSVYDVLKRVGMNVFSLHGGAPSGRVDYTGRLHFANLRAEMYWRFREALDPTTGVDIVLPYDRELMAELCAPKWTLTAKGILIEEKAKVAERLGRSPDKADATVMGWLDMEARVREYKATSSSSTHYGTGDVLSNKGVNVGPYYEANPLPYGPGQVRRFGDG